jgi:ATP-dependent DNA ligase
VLLWVVRPGPRRSGSGDTGRGAPRVIGGSDLVAKSARVKLPLIEPIVPVLYPSPFDGPEWLFEPKYDGFRGLFYLSGR